MYRAHLNDNTPDTLGHRDWYLQKYQNWTEGFRLGAANGLVEFR